MVAAAMTLSEAVMSSDIAFGSRRIEGSEEGDKDGFNSGFHCLEGRMRLGYNFKLT